jgi:hypothetical protein
VGLLARVVPLRFQVVREWPVLKAAFTWRVLRFGLRAFAVNIILVTALHPLIPIDFLLPIGTGFVTGRIMRAEPQEAILVGLVMSVCDAVLLTIIGLATALLSLAGVLRLVAADAPALILVGVFLVVHLGLFAGGGAILGGYTVRRERAASGL